MEVGAGNVKIQDSEIDNISFNKKQNKQTSKKPLTSLLIEILKSILFLKVMSGVPYVHYYTSNIDSNEIP